MNQYYVVNDRDSGKPEKSIIVDVVNQRMASVKIEQLDELNIGIKNGRYLNSNVELSKTLGTVALVNETHRFYGIMHYKKSKLSLYWITFDDFAKDSRKHEFIMVNDLINIESYGETVLNKNWLKSKGINIKCIQNLHFIQKAAMQFKQEVGFYDDGEEQLHSIGNTTEISNNSIEPASTYDIVLKVLRVNDNISIPKEYYSSLKAYVRKAIESNSSYTKYKAIVELKLNAQDENSLVVLTEYEESNEYVRVTVLKPFNEVKATQENLNDYLLEYDKWRQNKIIKFSL
jgi:hypothetical protein